MFDSRVLEMEFLNRPGHDPVLTASSCGNDRHRSC